MPDERFLSEEYYRDKHISIWRTPPITQFGKVTFRAHWTRDNRTRHINMAMIDRIRDALPNAANVQMGSMRMSPVSTLTAKRRRYSATSRLRSRWARG